MTTFRTLASGSSGNAALLSCGSTHLLIDMGISCRRVCRSLTEMGLTPEDLSAVLGGETGDGFLGAGIHRREGAKRSVPPGAPADGD